ncbi:MAG: SGNH/GDSL hydrolase family protein [Luteitalea sp.]|nr:SGNH/GDSL hydrolase family protein [Luteitalea sp.]
MTPRRHHLIKGARQCNALSICLLTCLLLIIAGCDDNDGPTAPTPPTEPNTAVYSALGASDAIGAGSSGVCAPFANCPNGMGYVQLIERHLRATQEEVTLVNLGLPGAVLSPEIERLGDDLGRQIFGNFLEREAPFILPGSTLVTIFAGANDTNTIAAAIEAGRSDGELHPYIDRWVDVFARDAVAVLERIRDRAPTARIVIANLPNLAALPYVASRPTEDRQIMQEISVRLTTRAINPLSGRGVLVVDSMCDARSYDPGLYSSDGFHPNDAGYAYFAEIYLAAITSGTTATPPASCSYMQLVPRL